MRVVHKANKFDGVTHCNRNSIGVKTSHINKYVTCKQCLEALGGDMSLTECAKVLAEGITADEGLVFPYVGNGSYGSYVLDQDGLLKSLKAGLRKCLQKATKK